MTPSSHPNVRLTHTRMYTRRVTTMEATIVKMSVTTRNAGPLFCLAPGGCCNVALIMDAQRCPKCIDRLGRRLNQENEKSKDE